MFYSDKPISSDREDLFHRSGFAKLLAKAIIDMNNTDTYTIGLFGKWGSGKTSLVNMMLQEIEKQEGSPDNEKIIIVHFEPWNFSDSNQLLNQFFIRLSNKFTDKKYKRLKAVGKAVETYADAFGFVGEIHPALMAIPFLGKKIGGKMNCSLDKKDILQQKEYIVELLKKQPYRILIVMDDIDRLSNEQIRQVFQLITAVAKFPNTTYLLAFDKEIVVKALKQVQEGYGEDYLEKIIQMPIQIPDIYPNDLNQALFDRLDNIRQNNKQVGFEKKHWESIFPTCIEPYIKNIRDINRLCNSVQFKLSAVSSEVDFADILALSTIELFLPGVYSWIKAHKNLLVGNEIRGFEKRSQNELYDYYKNSLRPLLRKNEVDFEEELLTNIIAGLARLFPYFGSKIGKTYEMYDMDKFRRLNQVAHPEKFDRYFYLDMDSIPMRKEDIMYAVYVSSYKELEDFLLERSQNGGSLEFIKEVKALIPDIPLDRATIIAQSLINVSANVDSDAPTSFFHIPFKQYAEHIIIELLDKLPSNERYLFLCNSIEKASLDALQVLAGLINTLELAYGRLAADGTERDYKKIITLDELLQIETTFCNKGKSMLENNSLFDFNDWRMVYHLLECFDEEYTKQYLENAFKEDTNILKYLNITVSRWIGTGTSYQIMDKYTKYLTKEQITEAVYRQKQTGVLFKLPEEVQNNCAAFFLGTSGNTSSAEHISQKSVDDLLDAWRKESEEVNKN